jgi:site-specific DNA-methyltransferase (adenine-specific)
VSLLERNQILIGDVRERLSEIPDASVDCVMTSPPYFQLRDYEVSDQLGLEHSVGDWVDELQLILRGLARVLKPSGSLWLNLGDTYSRHLRYGSPPKGLLLAPERLLVALAADGWIVRNKVIWAKTNPMPHSVSDRLTNTYDVVYFLVRSPRYFFDLDAIRLPHSSSSTGRNGRPYPPARAAAPLWRQRGGGNRGLAAQRARSEVGHWLGKNPGDVWQLAAANFRGAHFATFPPALVERPLLATCPEQVCEGCGLPFRRMTRSWRDEVKPRRTPRVERHVLRYRRAYTVRRLRGSLQPACNCKAESRPGVVLDPFFGAGTVGLVAEHQGRDWLGIELNPVYARLAEDRIRAARAERDESAARGERPGA